MHDTGTGSAFHLLRMKAECNSKAIAWVQVGAKAPYPQACEIEFGSGKTFLAFRMQDRRLKYRHEIDPKLLLRLLPDQWEGVEYIYQPPIRLPATS
jgi:hypothetical protein